MKVLTYSLDKAFLATEMFRIFLLSWMWYLAGCGGPFL
jgi:hypothetical protein